MSDAGNPSEVVEWVPDYLGLPAVRLVVTDDGRSDMSGLVDEVLLEIVFHIFAFLGTITFLNHYYKII